MKTPKKGDVEKIARKIVRMVRGGMKGLPPEEQERRLKSFCDAFGERPRTRSRASGSSRSAQGRMAARGRA